MNNPQPHGQQPYPPQQPGHTPAWGQTQQPGQPYPGGPYGPPPPRKKMSTAGIVGITIGVVFAFLVILGIALGDPEATDDKAGAKTKPTAEAPAKPSRAAPAKKSEAPAEPAEEAPVKVTAKNAKFVPSILHDGGDFTSVTVTVTNNGDEEISVNPLYFTITDTTGSKHQAELGEDKNQIDTMKLAPGEKTTGVITGKGKFTPKYVTYTDGLFGEGVRGNVS
ncbi:DUF4352 domain-containing protein [Streptomyces vilmorinianum]|uniref:DUF4352 domain-containing protein n=1 Tax=Streptomyces vilmorinianum TaxID=3051092 RepID=UPI0020C7E13D|nr:DUF4352 domain-containing protein [Streptomyces vilmorinianum]